MFSPYTPITPFTSQGKRYNQGEETHNNSVIPSKDSKFIQSSNEVPPRCGVASYKDSESEDGKGVHESGELRFLYSFFLYRICMAWGVVVCFCCSSAEGRVGSCLAGRVRAVFSLRL